MTSFFFFIYLFIDNSDNVWDLGARFVFLFLF